MAPRTSQQLRSLFCEFFTKKHDHKFVKPSSVLRPNDPSLEFTNAGMNQFKGIFLARSFSEIPDEAKTHSQLTRACNYQKCIRVGGKLCDIEVVGKDFRHHTFFEMLGNWSFGDYYKEEACLYAWQFLMNELTLDASKLFATHHHQDSECRDLWIKLGLLPNHVLSNDSGDNFWEMGSVGPCGMSTEIFIRQDCDPEPLEIWNLVFIDRERLDSGTLIPLQRHFVDTGMGLERVTAIMEGVHSNYDTDLFKPLFDIIKHKTNSRLYSGSLHDPLDIAYRIMADHIRMITMSVSDGLNPGRRGAPSKLRNTIRRVLQISRSQFKQSEPRFLLFDLVDGVVDSLGCAYPDIAKKSNISKIRRTIMLEQLSMERHEKSLHAQPKDN